MHVGEAYAIRPNDVRVGIECLFATFAGTLSAFAIDSSRQTYFPAEVVLISMSARRDGL